MSMRIFSPIQIKSMKCSNRILRSATWEALSDKDGFMSKKQFDGHKILKGGYFYEYAKEIAGAVSVPVYATGGFSDPGLMEKYMGESAIAGFGMSRAFLCEPNLVSRWMAGDLSAARCLHCSQCRTPTGNYCTIFNKN